MGAQQKNRALMTGVLSVGLALSACDPNSFSTRQIAEIQRQSQLQSVAGARIAVVACRSGAIPQQGAFNPGTMSGVRGQTLTPNIGGPNGLPGQAVVRPTGTASFVTVRIDPTGSYYGTMGRGFSSPMNQMKPVAGAALGPGIAVPGEPRDIVSAGSTFVASVDSGLIQFTVSATGARGQIRTMNSGTIKPTRVVVTPDLRYVVTLDSSVNALFIAPVLSVSANGELVYDAPDNVGRQIFYKTMKPRDIAAAPNLRDGSNSAIYVVGSNGTSTEIAILDVAKAMGDDGYDFENSARIDMNFLAEGVVDNFYMQGVNGNKIAVSPSGIVAVNDRTFGPRLGFMGNQQPLSLSSEIRMGRMDSQLGSATNGKPDGSDVVDIDFTTNGNALWALTRTGIKVYDFNDGPVMGHQWRGRWKGVSLGSRDNRSMAVDPYGMGVLVFDRGNNQAKIVRYRNQGTPIHERDKDFVSGLEQICIDPIAGAWRPYTSSEIGVTSFTGAAAPGQPGAVPPGVTTRRF